MCSDWWPGTTGCGASRSAPDRLHRLATQRAGPPGGPRKTLKNSGIASRRARWILDGGHIQTDPGGRDHPGSIPSFLWISLVSPGKGRGIPHGLPRRPSWGKTCDFGTPVWADFGSKPMWRNQNRLQMGRAEGPGSLRPDLACPR